MKQVSDRKKELRPISQTPSCPLEDRRRLCSLFLHQTGVEESGRHQSVRHHTRLLHRDGPYKYGAYLAQSYKRQWCLSASYTFWLPKGFQYDRSQYLVAKLKQIDIPRNSITNLIIDFLSDRSQRVKLGNDSLSEWGRVPSGVPQGTRLGLWLLLLMIHDLSISDIFHMWKYMDNTTVSETIQKGQQSKA